MTYLQLINKVLRELREKQVTDLSADYTMLIGQFVNEAKDEVERAWNWPALRHDVIINTVSGTQDYALANTTQKSKLIYDYAQNPAVYMTTSGQQQQLSEAPAEYLRRLIAWDQLANARPWQFSMSRDTTGMTASFYPKPDGVYAIQFTLYTPQAELSAADDVVSVPYEPVWKMALAFAASERGVGQNEQSPNLMAKAERALWGAITEEAEDGELTMYEA
jgi:hypothetical protein